VHTHAPQLCNSTARMHHAVMLTGVVGAVRRYGAVVGGRKELSIGVRHSVVQVASSSSCVPSVRQHFLSVMAN